MKKIRENGQIVAEGPAVSEVFPEVCRRFRLSETVEVELIKTRSAERSFKWCPEWWLCSGFVRGANTCLWKAFRTGSHGEKIWPAYRTAKLKSDRASLLRLIQGALN